jgi:hypothetical protein
MQVHSVGFSALQGQCVTTRRNATGKTEKHLRPARAMQSGLALPLQGEIYGSTLTHRVAVGCYAMPLKGRGKTCNPNWGLCCVVLTCPVGTGYNLNVLV